MKQVSRRKKALGIAVLALTLTACRGNTNVSEIGVHVTGYDMIPTSKHVAGCLQPGQNKYIGIGDALYKYPAGQRSFTFDSKAGSDFPPISVVSSDNVTLTYTGVVSFYLNPDCKTLEAFHTAIGSKQWNGHPAYINDGDAGWVDMLDVEFGKPAQNALTDAALKFPYLPMYRGDNRQQLEDAMQTDLVRSIKDLTGGDYFINFKVLLTKPTAPDNIVTALEDSQAAVQENTAQKAKNATAATQFDQITACATRGITEADCILLYAINSGKVTVLPIPAGSAVGVGTGK